MTVTFSPCINSGWHQDELCCHDLHCDMCKKHPIEHIHEHKCETGTPGGK